MAAGAQVGDRCRIQNHVSLFDGVVLEDDVFCGPSVVFTNVKRPRAFYSQRDRFVQTRICKGASVGANATILPGVEVGAYALIGAGAVVTVDVKPFAEVRGNPARQCGWVSRHGCRLELEGSRASCPQTGQLYLLNSDGQLVEEP